MLKALDHRSGSFVPSSNRASMLIIDGELGHGCIFSRILRSFALKSHAHRVQISSTRFFRSEIHNISHKQEVDVTNDAFVDDSHCDRSHYENDQQLNLIDIIGQICEIPLDVELEVVMDSCISKHSVGFRNDIKAMLDQSMN